MFRSVERVVIAQHFTEGGGFPVRRPFPNRDLDQVDPFLLLDEMGPVEWAPGEAIGAPDHPHRGFETVTYLLAGSMQHRDSGGDSGNLDPGDVQWMTAGSGVVHAEMPTPEFARTGGLVHGFQLWVNLPAADKMIPPRYQDLPAVRIPEVVSPDGLVRARVVAGNVAGVAAPPRRTRPILYAHFVVQPGGVVEQPVPRGYGLFAYPFKGWGVFGGDGAQAGVSAAEGRLVLFAKDGDNVRVENPRGAPQPLEFLLLGGRPIDEPVARYGPFVMNTEDELRQAFRDYQSGKMGVIVAWRVRSGAGSRVRGAPARDGSILVERLTRRYGDFVAVNAIDLQVPSGGVFGFLGPNGAGKTTLVKVLTTILAPSEGRAVVAGYDVSTQNAEVRRAIGVALQDVGLDTLMTARELLMLQARLFDMSAVDATGKAEELLRTVGLDDVALKKRVGEYSGGMKRRLDLALALVHRPRVLFLDEPTTGLDPASRTAIWDEVRRLNRDEGITIFLTTQYLEEADRLADEVAIIDHGVIVAQGSPAQLKSELGDSVITVELSSREAAARASGLLADLAERRQVAGRRTRGLHVAGDRRHPRSRAPAGRRGIDGGQPLAQ